MKNKVVTKPVVSLENEGTTFNLWVLDVGQRAALGSRRSMEFYAGKTASLIYETKGPGGHRAVEQHIDEPTTWEWVQKWMAKGFEALKTGAVNDL